MTAAVWLTIEEAALMMDRSVQTVTRWLYRETNPLPSSLRRNNPLTKARRMIKRSDALKYTPPQMGGKR